MQDSISVIIPHFNDLSGLDRCLTALAGQVAVPHRHAVIVADNGSDCGLDAVARLAGDRARVVAAPDRGAGPARNAAVAASDGTILAFIDSDCVAGPDWLAHGVAALAEADFVGGRVDVLVDHDGPLTGAEAFETLFAFNMRAYAETKGFVGSGNLFCPRRVFDAVGPFGNGISEDLDWCRRATAAGFVMGYCDAAAIGHPARSDWGDLHRKWVRINAETYGLFVRRRWGRLQWLARSWLLPLSIFAHSPRVLFSPKLARAGDRWRAWVTLARIRLWRFVDAHRLVFGNRAP